MSFAVQRHHAMDDYRLPPFDCIGAKRSDLSACGRHRHDWLEDDAENGVPAAP